jgi:putative hydrolase of the HAD superfamily
VIKALLLDLGNVVVEVDFHRMFRHWARHADVDPRHLHRSWAMDRAYEAHERGEIGFETYAEHLSDRLGIRLPLDLWREGWNQIFVGPYGPVQRRLHEIAGQLPLYAFTNTIPTHEAEWRDRYPEAIEPFDHVFASSTIGMRKPELDAYRWVADVMDLAPEEILFLDDTRENVDGALSAGLASRWVRSAADVVEALRPF